MDRDYSTALYSMNFSFGFLLRVKKATATTERRWIPQKCNKQRQHILCMNTYEYNSLLFFDSPQLKMRKTIHTQVSFADSNGIETTMVGVILHR